MTENSGKSNQSAMDLQFSRLTSRLFINAPFERLQKDLLKVFIDNHLQPEIGLEGSCLYENSSKDFKEVAQAFKKEGLACTIHAPFCDLAPGATDSAVLAATRTKLGKAFALIEIFEPVSIVCHLGYEENKHAFRQEQWLASSIETWQKLLIIAESHQIPVTFENTYETSPDQHLKILSILDSPSARFCLDVGHVMAFAKNSWRDWLTPLSPWLSQLHLHDNSGDGDDHLAIGAGRFDFSGLFSHLRQQKQRPIITLEPHQPEGLWDSLQALEHFELPEPPASTTT
ncbi:MAG: sugar phosphate isomerase/epimerase [Desulfobulbaceae bacterium]|nr:sugar phosphate isomerase/epimerase [Desulfobulbaceae bacterium]